MRRQSLQAEASTSRFYSCQTEKHLRPLLHLCLKFALYMHPQGSLCILNHVKFIPEGIHSRNHVKSYSLRTCTKRQGKRERDEHKERPNMYVYAKPGREEDWKILSLTFTSPREILELQEAQEELMNQMNEKESDRIRRTRTGLIRKWWKRSYGHVLKAFLQPTFCDFFASFTPEHSGVFDYHRDNTLITGSLVAIKMISMKFPFQGYVVHFDYILYRERNMQKCQHTFIWCVRYYIYCILHIMYIYCILNIFINF